MRVRSAASATADSSTTDPLGPVLRADRLAVDPDVESAALELAVDADSLPDEDVPADAEPSADVDDPVDSDDPFDADDPVDADELVDVDDPDGSEVPESDGSELLPPGLLGVHPGESLGSVVDELLDSAPDDVFADASSECPDDPPERPDEVSDAEPLDEDERDAADPDELAPPDAPVELVVPLSALDEPVEVSL